MDTHAALPPADESDMRAMPEVADASDERIGEHVASRSGRALPAPAPAGHNISPTAIAPARPYVAPHWLANASRLQHAHHWSEMSDGFTSIRSSDTLLADLTASAQAGPFSLLDVQDELELTLV